jgi:hypothetical protein
VPACGRQAVRYIFLCQEISANHQVQVWHKKDAASITNAKQKIRIFEL